MREIKFRAWHKTAENAEPTMTYFKLEHGYGLNTNFFDAAFNKRHGVGGIMQFTGLRDKNGSGDICFYEGDIVDLQGNLVGNRYEQTHLLENKSNLLIEGIGTKNWRSTEEEAVARGLGYAQ